MALVEDFDQEYPTLVLKSGQPSSFPPIPALSASDWQNTGKLEVLGFKYVQTMTVQWEKLRDESCCWLREEHREPALTVW